MHFAIDSNIVKMLQMLHYNVRNILQTRNSKYVLELSTYYHEHYDAVTSLVYLHSE